MQMKKFWWIEKYDVICTMSSGGTLAAILNNLPTVKIESK